MDPVIQGTPADGIQKKSLLFCSIGSLEHPDPRGRFAPHLTFGDRMFQRPDATAEKALLDPISQYSLNNGIHSQPPLPARVGRPCCSWMSWFIK